MHKPKALSRAKQILVATLAAGTIAVGGLTYHLSVDYAEKAALATVSTAPESSTVSTPDAIDSTSSVPENETTATATPESVIQATTEPTAEATAETTAPTVTSGNSDSTQSTTRGS